MRVVGTLAMIGCLLLAGAKAGLAQDEELPGKLSEEEAVAMAQATDNPLEQADAFSRAWMHERAIEVLEATGQESAELLWRLARSRIDMGENLAEDEAEPLYEQAYAEAERAAALAPGDPDAQLTLAVASGRIALLRSIFKAPGLVKQAYAHAHKAIDIDPEMPVALYVLGRTHKSLMEKSGLARKIAGLSFASEDSIAWYFDRALSAADNMVQCRVEYADYLIEMKDRPADAKPLLERAIAQPARDEQDVKAKKRASEMLAEL